MVVHIDLPGVGVVPAAQLAVKAGAGRPVWSLSYGQGYLARKEALPLDPVHLPLKDTVFEKVGWPFGVIRDALPDRWGTKVFDAWFAQRLRELGLPQRLPTAMDRLLQVKDDRVGALLFGVKPGEPMVYPADGRGDLPGRVRVIEGLVEGKPTTTEELEEIGTGSGGARPKCSFSEHGELWLAKFGVSSDHGEDVPGWECAAMRLLAQVPGCRVAGVRLGEVGGRRTIFVRRFDREQTHRVHYVSAGSILGCEPTDSTGSYPDLAIALRQIGAPREDRVELFRRMVFNVMIGNRDDHPWNHGILVTPAGFRLAPAFDVVPQPAMPAMQAMDLGRLGRQPTLENLMSSRAAFGLNEPEQAMQCLGEVAAVVAAGWTTFLEAEGVPASQVERLAAVLSLAREIEASTRHLRPSMDDACEFSSSPTPRT